MRCYKCNSNLIVISKPEEVISFRGHIVTLRDISCLKCPECGEELYNQNQLKEHDKQLEDKLNEL